MKIYSVFILLMLIGIVCPVNAQILSDDVVTVGLWHMDTATEYASPSRYWQDDDDSANPGRDNDLAYFSSNQPESILDASGYDGQAMRCDTTQYARTLDNAWTPYDDIGILKAEMWFKGDDDLSVTGAQEALLGIDNATILTVQMVYDSTDARHEINAYVKRIDGSYTKLQGEYNPGEWTHLVVYANEHTDEATLFMESVSLGTQTQNLTLDGKTIKRVTYNGRIYVGTDKGSRHLNGLIDEVKVSTGSIESTFETLADDLKTKALWHMDTVFASGGRNYVADDDSVQIGRDNDLLLGNKASAGTSEPLLTSGNVGLDGEALDFDGVDDIAYLVSGWDGESEVTVDMWIKPDDLTNAQTIVWAKSWLIRIQPITGGTAVKAWAFSDTAASEYETVQIPIQSVGKWYHVKFSVDDGTVELNVNGITDSKAFTNPLDSGTSDLTLGNKFGKTRWYNGLIEEVKITIPTDDMFSLDKPYTDGPGTIALWHMDSNEAISGNVYTPDDDVNNPGRDNDLLFIYNGTAVNDGQTDGPQLVSSFDPNFGNCLELIPAGSDTETTRINKPAWNDFPRDNVRAEAWVKLEAGLIGFGGPRYTICRQDYSLGLWITEVEDGQGGTYFRLDYLTWTDSGAERVSTNYTDLGANDWHHIAADFNDGVMSLYVDGVLKGTGTNSGSTLSESTNYFYVGSRGASSETFNGKLDEVRLSTQNLECGSYGYFDGDLNKDCYVDFNDLQIMVEDWLKDTNSGDFSASALTQDFFLPTASVTPTIDGVFGQNEWSEAKIIPMIYPDLIEYPQPGSIRPKEGGSGYDPAEYDTEDISGVFYYKWDSTNLYIFADITDNIFLSPDEPTSSTTSANSSVAYPDDHIMLSFDPSGSSTAWSDVLTVEFWRNSGGDVATHLRQDGNGAYSVASADMASTIDGNNWKIEIALPWSSIAGGAKAVDDQIGLGMFICDSDTAGSRDVFMTDIGDNVSTNAITDPSQYHTVTLTNDLVCGDNGYPFADIDLNCVVELNDFAQLAQNWVDCTDPFDSSCSTAF